MSDEALDTLRLLRSMVDDLDKEVSLAAGIIERQNVRIRDLVRENLRLSAEIERRNHLGAAA